MYFVPSYLKLKSFKVPEKNSILYSYTYIIYLPNLLFTLFQIKRNVLSYIIEALSNKLQHYSENTYLSSLVSKM